MVIFIIFIPMMDINGFIKRMGIDGHEGLAKKLGTTKKAVDSWSAGVRTPTYDMCVKLFELGMTVKELFGKAYPSGSDNPVLDLDAVSKYALRQLVDKLGI